MKNQDLNITEDFKNELTMFFLVCKDAKTGKMHNSHLKLILPVGYIHDEIQEFSSFKDDSGELAKYLSFNFEWVVSEVTSRLLSMSIVMLLDMKKFSLTETY